MSQQVQNNVVKYRKPRNINIGMIIFVIIFIHISAAVIMYFHTSHIVGYEVKKGSLSTNNIYRGIALRDEKIYTATQAGYIDYFVREGTHAAKGDLVYTVDEAGSLTSQLSDSSSQDISDSDLEQLRSSISDFSDHFEPASFSQTYDFKYSLQNQITELSSYQMLSDIKKISAKNSSLIHYQTTDNSGIVTYYTDGYEKLGIKDMTKDLFDESKYKKKQFVNDQLIANGDNVYKLCGSENWKVVIQTDAQTAKQLTDMKYVEVRFLKNKYEAWAQTESYTDKDGNTYVGLNFTNSMITYCNDRFLDIELLLENQSGLKIPNSSIVKKTFFLIPKDYFTQGGDNNSDGVLRDRYDDKGNKSEEFVETEIYGEKGDSYYVDDSVLRNGDTLTKPKATDKYPISETGTLVGVYNINKGYAEFREISILYQNDKYSIVKPNTTYGLSAYDYIVLDSSAVKENDLVYQ
jgi:hypothetical protein